MAVSRLCFPEQWERFRAGVPPEERHGDLIEAYHRLLHHPEPAVRARAAESWCMWESASLRPQPGPLLSPRFHDPEFALNFARIVAHYFRHDAWLEEGQLLRNAGALADIPGIMVHGRLDLQAPLTTAWELKQAWPRAELVIVDDAGHASDEPGMIQQLVRATDHFATH